MKTPIYHVQVGLVIFLVANLEVAEQVVASSTQATTPILRAYTAEQSELAREEMTLQADGATPAQLAAWRQQNAAALALQRQRLIEIAVANDALPQKENLKPVIPAGASANLTELLTTQAALSNARAHLRNLLVQQAEASGEPLSLTQMGALDQQATKVFSQKYSTQINHLAQLSQSVTDEAVQTKRIVPSATVVPPPNASRQLVAYLTAQRQLKISRIELMNQYVNASTAERNAALKAWYAAHAAQITQLQQGIASLTQSTAATTSTN